MERSPEIEAVTRRLFEASARGDAEAYVDTFADGIVFVGSDEHEMWFGIDEARPLRLRQYQEIPFFAPPDKIVGYANGQIGYSFSHGPAQFGPDIRVDLMRVTCVFALEKGAWRLKHWHSSLGVSNLEALGVDFTTSIGQIAALLAEEEHDFGGTETTLVFTDIESSTELAAQAGDRAWFEVLQAHDGELRGCAERHGGTVVKTIGDGAMLVFDAASSALRFARDLQATMRGHARLSGLRVRVGVHQGPAIAHDDDFFGSSVNYAARVADAARGGEVLVSAAAFAAVEGDDAFTFDEPFDVDFKGITGRQLVRALR